MMNDQLSVWCINSFVTFLATIHVEIYRGKSSECPNAWSGKPYPIVVHVSRREG